MTDARAGECYSVSVLVDLRAVIIFTDLARFRKGRWEMASLEEHWSAKQVFVAFWFVGHVLVVLVAGLLVHPQDIDILADQNLTYLFVFSALCDSIGRTTQLKEHWNPQQQPVA